MIRLRFFLISFALMAVLLLSVSVASAQGGATFVQEDYNRYVRLFKAGKEPDFRTDTSWRSAYSRNKWKDYADGTEFREPMPEAQVLSGLYLLNTVQSGLDNNIRDIVVQKGLLNKTLAETYVLDQIVQELEIDLVKADAELVGDFRGINIKMEKLIRQRMVSSVPNSFTAEVKAILGMFLPDVDEGPLAEYRIIREKIEVLDTLADSFAFNWSKEQKEKKLQDMMEDTGVQKRAEERARLEIEAQPKKLTADEVQEIKGRILQEVAKKELDAIVARHTSHKYLVGVYQGRDYHVGNIKQVYRYYLDAADKNNPIAQYHLALFLLYFGDILGMKREDVEQKSADWLQKAYHSDLTHDHVVAVAPQLVLEDKKAERREEETQKKIEKLMSLEHERMNMVENVLIQQAKKIKRINEVQRRIIEEMERERERQAITQRVFISALAEVEAARLARMAMIDAELARRMPTLFLPKPNWQPNR